MNPRDVSGDRIDEFLMAGINRISLGYPKLSATKSCKR